MNLTKPFMFTFLTVINLCGCTAYTQKLEAPLPREIPPSHSVSRFDIAPHEGQQASIGDELFCVSRYRLGPGQSTDYRAPTSIDFPRNIVWTGTHSYKDSTSPLLTVYTSPAYYDGTIGIVLDADGHLPIAKPIVQLSRLKKGRAWPMKADGKVFYWAETLEERWGVRYGGKKGSVYLFEIVNKSDANVTEILQSIEIDNASFLKGFVIRGVMLYGLKADEHGVITYKVNNTTL